MSADIYIVDEFPTIRERVCEKLKERLDLVPKRVFPSPWELLKSGELNDPAPRDRIIIGDLFIGPYWSVPEVQAIIKTEKLTTPNKRIPPESEGKPKEAVERVVHCLSHFWKDILNKDRTKVVFFSYLPVFLANETKGNDLKTLLGMLDKAFIALNLSRENDLIEKRFPIDPDKLDDDLERLIKKVKSML